MREDHILRDMVTKFTFPLTYAKLSFSFTEIITGSDLEERRIGASIFAENNYRSG